MDWTPLTTFNASRENATSHGMHYCQVLCNIGYPSESPLKLKSREILFVHNIRFNNPIVLKFCTEHGSITSVFCSKFQNDWTPAIDVMDERNFARFGFNMTFGGISYIAQHPGVFGVHFPLAVNHVPAPVLQLYWSNEISSIILASDQWWSVSGTSRHGHCVTWNYVHGYCDLDCWNKNTFPNIPCVSWRNPICTWSLKYLPLWNYGS